MGATGQLDDAIEVIRAAFADGADANTMEQGANVLQTMLSALQGAQGAAPPPPNGAAYTAPAPAIPKTKTPAPNLLDYVIYTLKEQLDDEDRANIEDQEREQAFNVPFINM